MFVREELKAKEVAILTGMKDTEDLWFNVRLTSGLVINICACYHPPKPIYDVTLFKLHLQINIGLLLNRDQNSVFVFTGDLNRLNTTDLQSLYGLDQIVNVATHNENILDNFITNKPDLCVVQVAQSLVKTKHKALIVNSKAECAHAMPRPSRTFVQLWNYTPTAPACCDKR